MVAGSGQPSMSAQKLAERLKDLREREYGKHTQQQLANVLGGKGKLSVATISQWETASSQRQPTRERLEAYARLFCSARSFAQPGDPRLLRDDELTEQEQQRKAELLGELLDLRDRAVSPVPVAPSDQHVSIWQFNEGAVSIVCSDAKEQPSYAAPSDLNYSRYARYSDLDALIEVFGQVRADNPETMVRILPTEAFVQDFVLNNVIIIGGPAVVDVQSWFADIPLPKAVAKGDTHYFECRIDDKTRRFESLRDEEDNSLVQDVGLIARGPHPNVPGRTVTVLSGITSRGVHGAALCFTNRNIMEPNQRFLFDEFGTNDTFCILMRVPVRNNVALPPNLTRDDTRLYEWSFETGARW